MAGSNMAAFFAKKNAQKSGSYNPADPPPYLAGKNKKKHHKGRQDAIARRLAAMKKK